MSTLWIDNEERGARSGATFTTPNPTTGDTLAELARGDHADIDAAVASAKRAFASWSRTDPNERQRILWKAGEGILARLEELARLETLDVGKPISNSRAIDVPRTADKIGRAHV